MSIVSRRFARSALVLLFTGLLSAPVYAADPPTTNDEKAFYALGTSLARQLQSLQPVSDREGEIMLEGLLDALNGRSLAVDQNEGAKRVRDLVNERQQRALEIERKAAADFANAEAQKPGAQKTESGLVYIETKAGDGASPKATDRVRVHYHGSLRDGSVFDSSVDRGEPAEFPLNRVIACWTEGVAKMKVGGKSTLICPASIAYGDNGRPGIPPGATLKFEVELLDILK